MTLATTILLTLATLGVQLSNAAPGPWHRLVVRQSATGTVSTSPLDYEVFKAKVQPILTSPREGNARCTACHSRAGGNAFLEPLAPGSGGYTEEQTRRNF